MFNVFFSQDEHVCFGLVWFGLVGFDGISNIVGYSMPNPLYTYILDIYDL